LAHGALNDVFSKYACERLTPYEISLWKYLFATVLIFLFVLYSRQLLKTLHLKLHFFVVYFFIATFLWVIGLKATHLATTVIIGSAIPFLVKVISYCF